MKRNRIAEIHFYEWRVGAWVTSETRDRLDATGRGIYRELLDHCYTQGKIPDDPEWMCRRCACSQEQLDKAWKVLVRHFPQISGTEYRSNVMADIFRSEYFSYVDQQKNNRAGKRRSRDDKSHGNMAMHNGGQTTSETRVEHGSTNGNGNGNGNGTTTTTATQAPQCARVTPSSDFSDAAERLYAAHPKKRDLALVPESLERALAGGATLAEIEECHAAWATSEDWTKNNGRYCPSLAKWLSDRGYTRWPEGHVDPDAPSYTDNPEWRARYKENFGKEYGEE